MKRMQRLFLILLTITLGLFQATLPSAKVYGKDTLYWDPADPVILTATANTHIAPSLRASTQYKEANKNPASNLVNDVFGGWDKAAYGYGLDNFAGAMTAYGSKVNSYKPLVQGIGRGLDYSGRALGVVSALNDTYYYASESRHNHSSLEFVDYFLRGFGIGTGLSATVVPAAGMYATPTGFVKDIFGGVWFSNIANTWDNWFIRFFDRIVDYNNWKVQQLMLPYIRAYYLGKSGRKFGWGEIFQLPALESALKPNIYLYPIEEMDVTLVFPIESRLLTVIPDYHQTWEVKVKPSGEIKENNQSYAYLFYESMTTVTHFQKQNGWVIPAENRVEVFEDILQAYHFNQTEIDDFIEFWDERLDDTQVYIMYPQDTKAVDLAMPLDVYPTPDSIYRLWFIFEAFDDQIITSPQITPINRSGFTLVEWGGIILE